MLTDKRENNLPQWAKLIIRNLRNRVETERAEIAAKLAKLEPQMQKLKNRNDALTELLECAARGGHAVARQITDIIATYLTEEKDAEGATESADESGGQTIPTPTASTATA